MQQALAIQSQALLELRRRKGIVHSTLLPHQVPPPGNWFVWVIRAGRGSGKTHAGSEYSIRHLRQYGKAARVGIGAPTFGDVRDVCAFGPSGLLTLYPREFEYNRSLMEATHTGGGLVKFMSAEVPDRWRGPQWSMLWLDELASWREESFDNAIFGLRLGKDPRAIVTTTPRPRKFLTELEKNSSTVVTEATTFDNPYLAKQSVAYFQHRYSGTRLGDQELLGKYVDDSEYALWKRDWIDNHRAEAPPAFVRIVVAVDPATTHTPDSDQTGICAVGLGEDGHCYVLQCHGVRLSPKGWADKAIDLYRQYEADCILAETNQGGEMVVQTLKLADSTVPVRVIHASRGKQVRAEPVALLYERGLVHHTQVFTELEEQMLTAFSDDELDDQKDAMVYAVTELMTRFGQSVFFDGGDFGGVKRGDAEDDYT